jgi:hypothetical protein
MRLFELFNLTEARSPALAAKYKNKIEARLSEDQSIGKVTLERFTEFLESKFNRYTEWVLVRYLNKNFLFEDLPRVQDAIAHFKQKKSKLEKKDINQYKSLSDLEDAVGLLDDVKSTRQQKQEIKNEGIRKIYEDEKYLLAQLLTEQAACFYGKNTKWCTAARENSMFNNYANQGPLYIIIDKKENRKYQLHYESMQFMDEADKSVVYHSLKRKYPMIQQIEEEAKGRLLNSESDNVMKAVRLLNFCKFVIKGRWPEAEKYIKFYHYLAIQYADRIINGPWPEAEPYIMEDPESAYRYAKFIMKARWPEAEKFILKDRPMVLAYAIDVIKARWPEAEHILKTRADLWSKYKEEFGIE